MADESDEQLRKRIRAASDAATGLDLDALRRKRDALRGATERGSLSVNLATLWSGRLAEYRTRRDPTPTRLTLSAGSQPTAVYSLPMHKRMRLWHIRRGAPEERTDVRINSASNRRDSSDD